MRKKVSFFLPLKLKKKGICGKIKKGKFLGGINGFF